MDNVGTATSAETMTLDPVAKCLTVGIGRPLVLGSLRLSALRAFDSTDETLSKTVKAVADMLEQAGSGDMYVGLAVAGRLVQAGLFDREAVSEDLLNANLADIELRIAALQGESGRVAYKLAASAGKSEARINVGTIGHVSRDKGTLAEALTKFGTQVIVDDMARDFAKQAVGKFVDEFNRFEAIKLTQPHITEKPYGRDHRKRFRR